MDATLGAMFFNRVDKYQNHPALRFKKDGAWHDITWTEFGNRVEKVANGLLALGIDPGDRVAILSENRPEWAMADLGIISVQGIVVPIYHTNKAKQIEFILQDSAAKVLFVSKPALLKEVLEVRKNLEHLGRIVLMDSDHSLDIPKDVMSFQELLELGADYQVNNEGKVRELYTTAKEDDLVSFVYTSGTTGNPKGVMLSHKNFLSNVKSTSSLVEVKPHEVALSFLPLSHVLERMAGYYLILYNGGIIAYAEGVNEVVKNLPEVKPNVMVSVPRLYEKMYAGILNAIDEGSPLKKKIFLWAVEVGKEWFYTHLEKRSPSAALRIKHSIADKLVYAKLRELTGGQLRFFVSGGAALAKDINEFFHAVGLPILEGYGLTETAPVLTVNTFEHLRLGTVGRAIPGVTLKIAEDGEILAKGPNVSRGYYNRPDATAESFKDGWFYTGDVGVIDEDGFLSITDRKKDIIVTSGGKNVAPQNIEGLLGTDAFISQAVVFGDKQKYLAALIIPDFQVLTNYAKENGISYSNNRDLIGNPKVVELYNTRIKEVIKDLPSYEQIKKFALLPEEFSQETGELTPSLKVRRKFVAEKYADILSGLFESDVAPAGPTQLGMKPEKPA
ncbi:MAG: long-chain fatty acid--CoA ligase [Clostridia bacterium]|nr:long-chain fatty acid--CoA ligase [Clostridia bacterium]